ncbi:hypothetical protein [Leifsonia sp. EB34]|uniref:hypothetical protein n=1 Tax=Leifsonia sp. EB34 TaxID=3156303 RepID=UPI003516C64D
MNDTPESGAPRLVSRRTVAKTAAWAAPAIALAAASPAHATSQPSAGVITIGQKSYTIPEGGAIPIDGTLTPTDGTLPADFKLQVECPDGFRLLGDDPLISYTDAGINYSFWVSAQRTGGTEGKLVVSSNYPTTSWIPASTELNKNSVAPAKPGDPRIFFSWEDQYYTVAAKTPGYSAPHTVTGQVRVPEGTTPPANMQVQVYALTNRWSITSGNGAILDVTPEGTFSFDVTQHYDNSPFGYFSVFWASHPIAQVADCYVGDWTKPRPDNWNDLKPEGWDDPWS